MLALGCAGGAPPAQAPRAKEPRAIAEPARRPIFMFSVDREGMPTSYLHGSVHLLKEGADEPAIEQAFAQSDALVVELDVTKADQAAVQAMTLQLGMYPEGDDITRHLAADTWQEASGRLERLGLPPEGAKRMRPWLLALTLTMLHLQTQGYSSDAGVDMRYLTAAHAVERPRAVIPLETVEEQVRALAGLSDDIQSLMVRDTVKQLDDQGFFDAMVADWREGDVEGLAETVFRSLREDPRFEPMYQALFFARNERMTERLAAAMLAQPRRYFVVVGAAHLVGPQSIPELLRARGFQVEQVSVPR